MSKPGLLTTARLPVVGAALALLGLVMAMPSRTARAQTIWEMTPYRIQVFLATSDSPELTETLRQSLQDELLARIEAIIGVAWDVTFTRPPPPLEAAMTSGIDGIAIDALPEESLEFDKVMLVFIDPLVTGYRVTVREIDVRTQLSNSPVRASVWQIAKLRDAVFDAMLESFAPLALVDSVDSDTNTVMLRVRAAALPARDKNIVPVTSGQLFQPVIRYNDREGKPRRITTVPWTFLSVEQVSHAVLTCKLHTGLRSPLSGRRRGLVQQLALAVRPPGTETRLILKSQTDPEVRLIGYDVYSQSLESKDTELIGRTNRQGSVTITPGEFPLRSLVVKHGGILLARLPLVPGISEEVEVLIPDDDQRLEAEGFLSGMQEDLIDLVIRRALLIAQTQVRIDQKKLDEAEQLVRDLHILKTREQFSRELSQQQKKTYADDPGVQRSIDAMFAETQKLLGMYLDRADIQNLVDKLAKARSEAARGG